MFVTSEYKKLDDRSCFDQFDTTFLFLFDIYTLQGVMRAG